MSSETMTLRHEGTDTQYEATTTHFDFVDGLLDVWIELESPVSKPRSVPEEIFIRLTHIAFDENCKELRVQAKGDFSGDYYSMPNAFVYSGFHHELVTAWVQVSAFQSDRIVAEIRIVTDDVDRYDELAQSDLIFGKCTFTRIAKRKMWGP